MDKNIMDVNAWLTKHINVFRPNSRDGDKPTADNGKASKATGKSSRDKSGTRGLVNNNKGTKLMKEELDHYRSRVHQLRDESNALYKDLITLRRDKSEYYECFARENNEAIMELICDIHRAEDEISVLETELVCSQVDESERRSRSGAKEETGREDFVNSEEPEKSRQQEVKNALHTLKEIVSKLKEQLANFHNYVSAIGAMQLEKTTVDDTLSQNNAGDVRKKEKPRRCDTLLKELGLRTHC